MTHILALLSKPTGRGSNRCWKGFLLNTIVQSEVEQFMQMVHQLNYFLVDPDELKRNEVGNFVFRGFWVMDTDVKVHSIKKKTTFVLR